MGAWRVSYHDFAIAFDCPAAKLPAVSAKELFIRRHTRSHRAGNHMPGRRYENFIVSQRPDIHRGFFWNTSI